MGDSGNLAEHFEDRRTPRSPRPGRRSPTSHSDHGSVLRTSLLKVTENRRAKKVRFYRNGDRFFKGMVYAVSPERFRTFESLMVELTSSAVCDKKAMPKGVRHVFNVDGSKKITSLDELEEGESYICASYDVFRKLDYVRACSSPNWNQNRRASGSRESTPAPLSGGGVTGATGEGVSFGTNPDSPRSTDDGDPKDYVRPKLITVIRNGSKPRKAVRVLLNRKTAHSFDQVLTDITDAIKLDSGAVRRVYTVGGRQVTCLSDFFHDDTIFIAYGQERLVADDFDLVDSEVRHVNAYKASPDPKTRDRVTLRGGALRGSPKPSRRSSTSSASKEHPPKNGSESPTAIRSPKSPRKPQQPVSAPKYREINGAAHRENGHNGASSPSSVVSPGENGDNEGIPIYLQDRYEIGDVIGEGNFAVVRECIDKTTGRRFALKIIDKAKCKGKEETVANEVSILKRVKHPNIVQLVEDKDTPRAVYLVMDLVKGGDLFEAISSSTKYTEKDASGMIYNLVSALQYLHSLSIVHRDIKPENILVCDHGDGSKSLLLGDFGLATEVPEGGALFTVCGTPSYVAPEVIAEQGYGVKVDLWSAGVIGYILLCGFPPFCSPTDNQEELFDLIMAGKFDFPSPFWDHISDAAKDLIQGMLEVNPDKRLTAEEVLAHPWVSDDIAGEEDFHQNISQQLQTGSAKLHIKRQPAGPAAVRLIATTALDKGSRYFQGRGSVPLALHTHGENESEEDEIF